MVDGEAASDGRDPLAAALNVLRDRWSELSPHLDDTAWAELAETLAEREGDPIVAGRIVWKILRNVLPADHHLRGVLAFRRDYRNTATAGDVSAEVAELLDELNTLFEASLASSALRATRERIGGVSPAGTPEQYIPDERDQWLLAEPSVSIYAVRWDVSWADDVVVLHTAEGEARVPAFQLDGSSGRPRTIVLDVNRRLSADVDPWGAADWWLGSNVWLPAPPARLLGTQDEGRIMTALRAESADW